MSLIEGISDKTARAAVDEFAEKVVPELDPEFQHFAEVFAKTLVESLAKAFAGKTLTFTIKLGE